MLGPDDVPIRLRERETLTEDDIWLDPTPTLWSARRFVGSPRFYPVYRRGDLYSFSPVFLLAHKRAVDVDPEFVRRVGVRTRSGTAYYSGRATIDREIERIGGPTPHAPTIFTPAEYARRLAAAMIADIERVEAVHPGVPHVVLCGGKDSLNMLLLPWRSPVLAVSARPNYPLVREFIAANGLAIECLELRDEDRELLPLETFYNVCLSELIHCRWSGELRALAAKYQGRVIFWKGQVATFLTPSWRAYIHYVDRVQRTFNYVQSLFVRAALRVGEERIPAAQQRRVYVDLWRRGAMMQGTHMGLLRALCGCLVLSGYHGPNVQAVISAVDLPSCVRADIRPAVGRVLLGRAVVYPTVNPGPPESLFRGGRSDPATWVALARANGWAVRG